MRSFLSLVVMTLCLSVGYAPAQLDVTKTKPETRWPVAIAPPAKPPIPNKVIAVVARDSWFLIERDEPAVVTGSQASEGLVSVKQVNNKESCQVRYKGKIAGMPGDNNEKVVTSKYIYEVSPVRSGPCEIFVIPLVIKTEADIERQIVQVIAPQPPPGGGEPTDPPTGGEPPVVTPKVGYFLIVRKDGPREVSFDTVMQNEGWNELKKLGHTVKEMNLTESIKFYKPVNNPPIPFVATLDQKTGKVIADAVALPTTTEGIIKLKDGVK